MASKYWIKLYHEMLYDRKIVTLDDRLWRRFTECLLLAGEQDKGGFLPTIEDIAFILRANQEQIETELNELVRIKLLEIRDGLFFVTKFARRQAKMPKAEYMRRLRAERQKEEHYQSVTSGNTDEEVDIDKEEEEEWTPTPFSNLSAAFVNITHIPELTGGAPKWNDAIAELVKRNITVDDLKAAYNEVAENYQITGPWSLINPATIVMSRRLKKSESARSSLEKKGYEFRS